MLDRHEQKNYNMLVPADGSAIIGITVIRDKI